MVGDTNWVRSRQFNILPIVPACMVNPTAFVLVSFKDSSNDGVILSVERRAQTKAVFTEVAQSSSRASDLLSSVYEPKSSELKQNKYISLGGWSSRGSKSLIFATLYACFCCCCYKKKKCLWETKRAPSCRPARLWESLLFAFCLTGNTQASTGLKKKKSRCGKVTAPGKLQ